MKYSLYLCGLVIFWSCTNDPQPVLDNCASLPEIKVLTIANATNCSTSDGQIQVLAVNGESPYTFKIDDNAFQADSTFVNLGFGEHTIEAMDFNGCTGTSKVTVGSKSSSLAIQSINIIAAGCQTADGVVVINAIGQGTLKYSLNGTDFQESNTFGNVSAGSYLITVTDDSGCELANSSNVNSGVSFANQIESIITTNCTLVTCHDGNNSLPDLTKFENIKNRAADIKSRTQSGNMPRGRTLSQQEKDLIACWVDDGALNN